LLILFVVSAIATAPGDLTIVNNKTSITRSKLTIDRHDFPAPVP